MLELSTIENNILAWWRKTNLNQKLLTTSLNAQKMIFVDGPPFVTGTPHLGHLMISSFKDLFVRYYRLLGFNVINDPGFDTHGVPIEQKVKEHQLKEQSLEDFISSCNKYVYSNDNIWKNMFERIGRLCDFDKLYRTCDRNYMLEVWKLFKIIYDKGLIYEDYRIMPYSYACETSFSDFETKLNYKTITEKSLYVMFQVQDLTLLVWTTTPWTLVSNIAICVNSNLKYSLVEKKFICLTDSVKSLFSEETNFEDFDIKQIIGKSYKPIFNYTKSDYLIVDDNYVRNNTGTGCVHIAPGHGNDDYRVSMKYNLIKDDICFVNSKGYYTERITDFENMHVKNIKTENAIIDFIKDHIFKEVKIKHEYPHCWRSNTPLINVQIKGYFINITKVKQQLIDNAKKINFSNKLTELLFNNWVEGAGDWCISRSRIWGNPIPIWKSEDGDIIVLDNIESVRLHRDNIDKIEIKQNGKVYKRIPEVLDCWFESAAISCMQSQTVDLVLEGNEQYKLWFYTQLVLSTIIKEREPFKNVVTTALILSAKRKKMSKSEKNNIDPMEIIETFSNDGLRLYYLSQANGENFVFNEQCNVMLIQNQIIIKLLSTLNFLNDHYNLYKQLYNETISQEEEKRTELDEWFINTYDKLEFQIIERIKQYKLEKMYRMIHEFIEKMTNDFIRLSRPAFKSKDKTIMGSKLSILYRIMTKLTILMSPMIVYFSEYLYNNLLQMHENNYKLNENYIKSVHFEKIEESQTEIKENTDIEDMNSLIVRIRKFRIDQNINNKVPVKEITINKNIKQEIAEYIKTDCNIINLKVDQDQKEELTGNFEQDDEIKDQIKLNNLVRQIQDLRREGKLKPIDKIEIYYIGDEKLIEKYQDYLQKKLNYKLIKYIDQEYFIEKKLKCDYIIKIMKL